MFKQIAFCVWSLLAALSAGWSPAAEKELWVYCPANFLVDSECERVEAILARAAKAGYTHALVTDSKFSRLAEMDKRYFNHIEHLRATAKELKIALVPACCPVGYSNDLLALDPNMAEALPVSEAPYQVENNRATRKPDPNIALPPLTERKRWGFIDEVWVAANDGLVATGPFNSNARVMKQIRTEPFQQYHASVWIKAEDFPTRVELKVLDAKGRSCNYTYLNSQPTQDWTQHHVTFNSLNNRELNLYIGAWGPTTGKLWLRDAKLEASGAVNLVRRDTAPIRVQLIGDAAPVDLKENVDFEAWSDPKLGTVPYRGEFETWHEPPAIQLKRNLPAGSQLKVSYFHTHVIHDAQVCGTIGDAKFEWMLKQQATAVTKLIPERSYMMSHDEYRLMGWTSHSLPGVKKDANPGELLTHNAEVCFQTIRTSNPQARVLTWSDMFDPFHNAVEKYYLVNGSLTSAQLPKDVVVVNWNSDKMADSLTHFEKLGHHQIIAGYYDQTPTEIKTWLNVVVENKIKQVDGVMYTTWNNSYRDLEAFADNVRKHAWYAQ